jgi:subtilase family protein/LGFP repeat-containing protein
MPTPIEARYAELLPVLNLGAPQGPEQALYDGGSMQAYALGRIYYHPRLAVAYEVHGAILGAYLAAGAELSPLGYPTTDEGDDPYVLLGRMSTFEFGTIRWGPGVGITVEVDETEPDWVRRVCVKLVDGVPAPLGPGEEMTFASFVPGAAPLWLGDAAVRRCFGTADTDALVALAQAEDPAYDPPRFDAYLEIDVPDGVDPEAVATLCGQLAGVVEYAYAAGTPNDPGVVGTGNPLFAKQTYLAPAPTGIGVASAWAKGADGSGIRIIDIEKSWKLDHHDLPRPIRLLGGVNQPFPRAHGTAVLGTIAAVDDARGVVGVAPACNIAVLSYATPAGQKRRSALAEAIANAASALAFGDVLLLEAETLMLLTGGTTELWPIEMDPDVYEAIRVATKLGVIVIEPAANGNVDLDQIVDFAGRHVLDRTNVVEFRDSGAIMVGACTAAHPHQKLDRSNFGSRIDCHAFGERIATTGDRRRQNDPDAYFDPDFEYVPGQFGFGGTSGASAIVAGLCLLVQQLRAAGPSGRIGPFGMRRILADVANGTDSFLVTDKIGAMPDLAKVIANELGP